MYIRRAYTAYEVMSVLQEELTDDISVLQWEFLLPQNHPNRAVSYRRASSTSLGGLIGKVILKVRLIEICSSCIGT